MQVMRDFEHFISGIHPFLREASEDEYESKPPAAEEEMPQSFVGPDVKAEKQEEEETFTQPRSNLDPEIKRN